MLRKGSHFQKLLGIYMLSHIPILVIYHAHLSIGGVADRLYWLIFGFLALPVGAEDPRTARIEIVTQHSSSLPIKHENEPKIRGTTGAY